MITIILVDDQPAVRKGLRMRLELEAELQVVGEAGNGHEALDLISRLHPEIVLMDMEMTGMNGPEATEKVLTIAPDSKVIILTIHDDEISREQARRSGAAAFISKHADDMILLHTIRGLASRSRRNSDTSQSER